MKQWLWGMTLLLALSLVGCSSMSYSPETTLADRDLVGYAVQDVADDVLGEVASIIVDIETGEISYIVIRRPSGPLAYRDTGGARLIPIPWRIVSLDRGAQVLIAEADLDVVRNAPGFEALPNTRLEDWDEAIQEYWDTIGDGNGE